MNIVLSDNKNASFKFGKKRYLYATTTLDKSENHCQRHSAIIAAFANLGLFLLNKNVLPIADSTKLREDYEFIYSPLLLFVDIRGLSSLAKSFDLDITVFATNNGELNPEDLFLSIHGSLNNPTHETYTFQGALPDCVPTADTEVFVMRKYPHRIEVFSEGRKQLCLATLTPLTLGDIEVREGLCQWFGLHRSGIWVYANSGKELAKILKGDIQYPAAMDVSRIVNINTLVDRISDGKWYDVDLNTRSTVYFIYRKLFKVVDIHMLRSIYDTIPLDKLTPIAEAWLRVPQASDDELTALIRQI